MQRPAVPLDAIALALQEARAVSGDTGRRAAVIALAGVTAAFPWCARKVVAERLGLGRDNTTQMLRQHRASRSWDETHVDHVVGALVADQYGDRAA